MTTKFARDIMVPLDEYPHIPHWYTLKQAVAELEKSEIKTDSGKSLARALLVFDESYQLLGILRRRDILKGLEPKFLQSMSIHDRKQDFDIESDPNLIDLSTGKMADFLKELAGHTVDTVMQPITATVAYDDHLAKLIYKMVSKDMSLLPVIKDDIIVGVVRSVDVFNEVANIIR